MNTSISIINDEDSALLEELYGSTVAVRQESKLGSLKLVQTAKMGDLEVAGKILKTEVIPVGAYELYINKQKVYCINPLIRFFGKKYLYTYWDDGSQRTQRTVLVDDEWLKGDLKDTMGTFNVGRGPSVKDWEGLSSSEKTHYRERKHTLCMMGKISFDGGCMDETGKAIEGLDNIPFTMEITNAQSKKALNDIIHKINKKYECTKANVVDIRLDSIRHEGSIAFSTMSFSIKEEEKADTLAEFISRERETVHSFTDWIKMRNTYVTEQWSKLNKEELNSEEETLVSQLVNVEGAAI